MTHRARTLPTVPLLTFPACPTCGERMEPVIVPANHDRPAVRFLRCTCCGVEDRHEVEREAVAA